MARDEKKGQMVKTFKAHVPQTDLSYEEMTMRVYFQASEGQFRVYPPQHIVDLLERDFDVVEAQNYDTRDCRFYHGALRAVVMQRVIDTFGVLCRRYVDTLLTTQRKRVIRVQFKANHPRLSEYVAGHPAHISFAPSPAIAMTYQVLWEAGGKLYDQDRPDLPLRYVAAVVPNRRGAEYAVIDWTEEREAFFANMEAGMVGLIERLIEFMADLEGNVQAVIEGRANAVLSLPAPVRVRERPRRE